MSDKKIDPALAVEIAALRHQDAMNSVIDRGDSPIQQFYNNSTILVTGGTGFIGKQLIEKLFRSCNIKKMFLLMRARKGKSMQQRLEYMLKDPVYDGLHSKQPGFVKKLVPIECEIGAIGLKINEADRKAITEEVDVIFHLAATVRFDESIQKSIFINVRGTRELISLATECTKLRKMIHVSTAYAFANNSHIDKEIFEEILTIPMPPELVIELAETLDEAKLIEMTPTLIKDWPNTYSFTKAITEHLVKEASRNLPICIVRPPIVTSSYCEPMPGWLDTNALFGGLGLYLAIAVGILRVTYVPRMNLKLVAVPVDYVNNAIIAAGWDSAMEPRADKQISVYTVANGQYGLSWKFIKTITENEAFKFSSTKAIWYTYNISTNNKLIDWILRWLLHYLPAYLLDGICFITGKRPKQIKSFIDLYTKIDKMSELFHYYRLNAFHFQDHNVRSMISRMSAEDKHIYNCDIRTIDYHEYILIWGIGIKKYILKEGLNNSAEGVKRQKVFMILNFIVAVIYLYLFWCILHVFWKMIEYVL